MKKQCKQRSYRTLLSTHLLVFIFSSLLIFQGKLPRDTSWERPIQPHIGGTASPADLAEISRVKISGDKLYLDDKPFFPFGFFHWLLPIEESYFDEAKMHGVNTVLFYCHPSEDQQAGAALGIAQFAEFLHWVEVKGIMVIPYIDPYWGTTLRGHPWNENWVERYLEFKGSPAILAWDLFDDATTEGMDMYLHYRDFVKSRDPDHPIYVDDNVLRGGESSFLPCVDIICAYIYPLFRDGEVRHFVFEGGLEDQQILIERMKDGAEKAGKAAPMWTIIQAHTQDDWNKLGLPEEKRGYPPEPEPIRLLSYMAISRGVRGLLYFQPLFLTEEFHGRDRYAEIGIIGSELKLFGEMIAGGDLVTGAKTNHTEVEAACIRYGDSQVVILTKHGGNYQIYVDEAVTENVMVEIPHPQPQGLLAYSLSFPEVKQLKCVIMDNQTVQLTVNKLELTDFLLLTHDQGLVSRLKAKMAELLPNVAGLAVEVAEKKGDKVASVANQLIEMGWSFKAVDTLLTQREEELRSAKNLCEEGDYKGAYNLARHSQLLCRRIEAKYMEQAQQYRETAGKAKKYFLTYYLLPEYLIHLKQQHTTYLLLLSIISAGVATAAIAIILRRKKILQLSTLFMLALSSLNRINA